MIRSFWREGIAQAATIALVSIVVSSCSDDPSALNSVGTQLLRTKIIVKTDTLKTINSSTARQYVPMDGRTNLLGRSGGPNGYAAYTLVQFYPAYLPQRDTVQILSATLSLRGETLFGDSTATFGFTAYRINRAWDQITFRWDSLTSFYDSNPVSDTYFQGVGRDTQWVNVNLDTAMVRKWLQPLTFTDNFGVILIPGQNTNVVRGVHTFGYDVDSLYPQLVVVARNLAGTVTDTTVYKIGQDTFVGNIDNLDSNPELIYVQAGVSYRGFLKFDVATIPRGAIINQARLSLAYSPAASRLNRFTTDTAIAAHLMLSATDNRQFEVGAAVGTLDTLTPNRFVFDIRHDVQYWIKDPTLNNGLIFRTVNRSEFSSFDLFALYNQTTQDSSKRPQLIVKYTVESN